MKEENQGPLLDWRGTPINIGDTVVYTATHGRSGSLVEATVKSFTATGRVILDVVRESFGYREGKPVNIAAGRVTVVSVLPPSTKPTLTEQKIKDKTNLLGRYQEDLQKLQSGEPLDARWAGRTHYDLDYVTERVQEITKELKGLRAKL